MWAKTGNLSGMVSKQARTISSLRSGSYARTPRLEVRFDGARQGPQGETTAETPPEACVVDTDVVSYLFRGSPVAQLYRKHLTGKLLVISFMTLAEIRLACLKRDAELNVPARWKLT